MDLSPRGGTETNKWQTKQEFRYQPSDHQNTMPTTKAKMVVIATTGNHV